MAADPPLGLRRRALRSILWSGLSFGGNRLVVFAGTLALARLLTPTEFGVVTAAMTLVLLCEIGLDLGVGASVIYDQERGTTGRVQTAFSVTLLVSGLLVAVGWSLAPEVSAFFGAPDQDGIFRATSCYLLLRGAGSVPDALLRRDLQFGRRAGIDVARALVRTAVSVVLAALGHGAESLVVGLLVAEAVAVGLTWWATGFLPTLRLRWAEATSLMSFGLAVFALRVVDTLSADGDYLVVGGLLGPAALGQYTLAFRLPELLLLNLYWVFSSVAFPLFAAARASAPTAPAATMLTALRLVTLFGFTVGVALALLSRDAVTVLFPAEWAAAAAPMTLLSLAMALASIGYASGDLIPALGRPGLLLMLNTTAAAVLLTSMVLVAPRGLAAVAGVHLLVQAVHGLARLQLANHLLGVRWREDVVALRPGLCAAAGAAALGLPLRLFAEPGAGTLAGLVVAVSVGAVLGLLLGARPVFAELRRLGRDMLTR